MAAKRPLRLPHIMGLPVCTVILATLASPPALVGPSCAAEPRAPTVFPLVQCNSLYPQSEVTIGCLSTGYFPNQIDVQWNAGAITRGIKNFPAVLERNGHYLSTSQLTISASEWESKSKSFQCDVIYKPTNVKITKKIEHEGGKKIPPTVEVTQASCGESGSVDLVCLISGYSPSDINIEWLLNGQRTSISPSNSTPYKENDGTYGSSSRVSVPKEDWQAGDTLTCRVSHPASATKVEDKIHKCTDVAKYPKVTVLPPSPKDLLISKEPKLICFVSQLTSASSLNIKWTRSDGKRVLPFTSGPDLDDDGSYMAKSTLKISLADWNSKIIFTCIVQHSDLPSPIEKTIQKRDVEAIDPSVYVYPPSEEELKVKDFVSVNCMIKGFDPKDIYIQWLKNGVVQDEDYYINTEPIHEEDESTYLMFSRLTIEKSDWNRGATFTCKAAHKNIISNDIKKSKEYIIWDCSSEDDDDSLWSTAATFITLFLISIFYSATITFVKVKWFISRILQFDKHDDHFITVLDSVTQGGH